MDQSRRTIGDMARRVATNKLILILIIIILLGVIGFILYWSWGR
jgi:hypothetical protein